MEGQEIAVRPQGQEGLVRQADSDEQVVAMWLHGRGPHTQRAYAGDVKRFAAFVGSCPLGAVKVGDVQDFASSLEDLAPSSQARILSAVKSLLSFGQRIGYLPFNVGAVVRLPPRKDTLAERIIGEADVQRMIALETGTRNRVLLRLLYAAGLRASELCGLRWRDVQEREDAGQVTTFGKGGKTRAVLLSAATWQELVSLRPEKDAPAAPVFRSRAGGALHPSQVARIVSAAAGRAGVAGKVSPHWLRHAHASHALDRGCPISLVQATLGHASVATTGQYLHARPNDSSARYLGV